MFSELQGQMQGSGYRFRTLNVLKLLYLFSMIVQYEKSVKIACYKIPRTSDIVVLWENAQFRLLFLFQKYCLFIVILTTVSFLKKILAESMLFCDWIINSHILMSYLWFNICQGFRYGGLKKNIFGSFMRWTALVELYLCELKTPLGL